MALKSPLMLYNYAFSLQDLSNQYLSSELDGDTSGLCKYPNCFQVATANYLAAQSEQNSGNFNPIDRTESNLHSYYYNPMQVDD